MIEVIGTTEDIKRGAIISFVWAENGMHFIAIDKGDGSDYQYILKNTVDQSILDFRREKRIKANVVGDMLYWNDGYTNPHKVNIEKAVKTNLQQTGGYPFFTEAVISALKFTPIHPPVTEFSTNATIKGNSVRGHNFQFKYRYIYDDHDVSICSPVSKCIISNDVYDFYGKLYSNPYLNNSIDVSIAVGPINAVVIQLFVRENSISDWFMVSNIKKADIDSEADYYTYSFSNNEARTGVDQIDVNRQYEYLPDLADAQEFIDGKYMAYGGITDGQDLVPIDVDFSIGTRFIQTEDFGKEGGYLTEAVMFDYKYKSYYQGISIINDGVGCYTKIYGINTGVEAGKSISIDDGKSQVTYITVGSDSSPLMLREHLAEVINSSISMRATIGYGYDVLGTYVSIIYSAPDIARSVPGDEIWVYSSTPSSHTQPTIINLSVYMGITPSNLVAPVAYPSVKTGVYHKLGIVYTDKSGAKKSTVNKSEACDIYVPTLVDLDISKVDGNGVQVNLIWEINHRPPEWAYAYSWVYAGNAVEWFIQFILQEGPFELSSKADFVYINIEALNKLKVSDVITGHDTNMGSSLNPYEFKVGDRIRILTQRITSYTSGQQFPVTNIATVLIDEEILGYETISVDGVETPTDRIKTKGFDFASLSLGLGSVFEIYTPKKITENDIYYEIGESFPILNPGTSARAHGGQSYSQSFDPDTLELLAPAKGVLNKLGSYVVTRQMPYSLPNSETEKKLFFTESMQYNDFFESYALDQGNPNVYDPEARRVKLNTIRRSKAYFEGTNTNGLATFYYDNYITLTSRWGNITGMETIGGTLKVLLERKQVSIYIGANSLKQAKMSGVDVVVSTDNVFGGQNESEDLYGTMAPESVIVVGRHMFFYDQSNSCIVRDAANGPLNISEPYKIRTWLQDIGPILWAADYSRVISGYSPQYEEVWMSFYAELNGVITLSETLVFDAKEQSSGFRFVDLNDANGKTADAYCSLSKELFLYREAELYQCDAGNYREFLGVKYPLVVEFCANINPATRKIFNALAVNSNTIWSAPEYGDIIVNSGYQGRQPISKLFASNFRKTEGVWYAPLNRNAVYKTINPTVDSLYNGEPLRGESLGIKLTSESDEQVTLHSAIVKCTVSEKTY